MQQEAQAVIYDPRGNILSTGHRTETSSTVEFSFGDPEPIVGNITGYLETFLDLRQEYYEPPIDFNGLSRVWRQSPVMESAIFLRRNTIVNDFLPNALLKRQHMEALVLDYEISGNAFLRKILGGFGKVLALEHINFRVMRRMREKNRYLMLTSDGRNIKFDEDEIIHIREYGPESDIYGLPEHIGALNSVWLDEAATLFRRKYYTNGAHMGYVFYLEDHTIKKEEEKLLQQKIQDSKGVGNFRTMYYNNKSQGKAKDGNLKIIPVGDLGTKDEYQRVKSITEQDVFRSKRVFPHGMGGVPKDVQVGDAEKAFKIFLMLETNPKKKDISEAINPHLQPRNYVQWGEPPILEAAAG